MIETKCCNKCGVEKPLINFGKEKQNKDGFKNICKNCFNEKQRANYEKSKSIVRIIPETKCCSKCNITKTSSNFNLNPTSADGLQSYCKNCQEELGKNLDRTEYHQNRYETNKEKIQQQHKEYKENNKEKRKITDKIYREKNKEQRNAYNRKHRAEKRDHYSKKEKERRDNDPILRIMDSLYSNIRGTLNRFMNGKPIKNKRAIEILGCSAEEFIVYIEKQFEPGMTWENWGLNTWHLDHIKPKSWATNEIEAYEINHYTNFQPKWAKDNLKKGNRYCG